MPPALSPALYPPRLAARPALALIQTLHRRGWEKSAFCDAERVLECVEFTLCEILVPPGTRVSSTHATVVALYRDMPLPPPPPFLDLHGLIIDGTHRIEAMAGRSAHAYIPSAYLGPLVGGLVSRV